MTAMPGAGLHRSIAEGRALVQGMSLGDGVALITEFERAPWACACIGPPLCCSFSLAQAHDLRRAAHSGAKLLTDRGGATP